MWTLATFVNDLQLNEHITFCEKLFEMRVAVPSQVEISRIFVAL